MKARNFHWALLACLAAVALAGCQRNIVRAAPPSVIAPPAPPQPQPPPEVVLPPAEAKESTPLETLPEPAENPEPEPVPVRPKPAAPVDVARPKEPETPQISPELSASQLADAQRRTTQNIAVAEKNLQVASGKDLNASQKDLLEKVRGFLEQAHEAVRATDWVRAQSLAEKAQLLSAELVKSF